MSRIKFAAFAAAVAGLAFTVIASAQVQRTFVASYGSDANTATNCGFTNPCRGFAAALTKTSSGGEIVALDAAGYGAVTIDRSVTITANPGFYAGISASAGNAVTINTASVDVVLRGLNINGIGAANGVSMTNGTSLSIENCVISNFGSMGVSINTPARARVSDTMARGNGVAGVYVTGGAIADVLRSKFIGNQTAAVYVDSAAGVTTRATVSDSEAAGSGQAYFSLSQSSGTSQLVVTRSTASNGAAGVLTEQVSGTAQAWVSGSTLTGNTLGLWNFSGTMFSLGNNTVRANGTDVSGVITTIGQN